MSDKGRNEHKFLGSLVLLVAALAVFVALLVYFAPEDEETLAPTLATEETQLLRKSRSRPLRREREQVTESAPVTSDTVVADNESKSEEGIDKQALEQKIDRAVALIDGGNPDEALVILEEIIRQDPSNERALIEISMVHLIDYRDASASVPWLERTLQVNPSNRLVLAELAAIYAEQDNIEGGMTFLQGMQKEVNSEQSSFISLAMGHMLMSDKREDEAVVQFEQAAAGLPHNPDVITNLASAYARRGNSDKAITTYRKSVALREGELHNLPAKDKGRTHQRKLLLLTRIEIVKEYYRRGDLDAASKELEEVSKHVPNSPLVTVWRKRIERKAG